MNLTSLSITHKLLKRIAKLVNKGLLVRYGKARGVWYAKPNNEMKASNDHTPNEKSAKLLLASDEEKDYKGFNNLDDLFSDLEI